MLDDLMKSVLVVCYLLVRLYRYVYNRKQNSVLVVCYLLVRLYPARTLPNASKRFSRLLFIGKVILQCEGMVREFAF